MSQTTESDANYLSFIDYCVLKGWDWHTEKYCSWVDYEEAINTESWTARVAEDS